MEVKRWNHHASLYVKGGLLCYHREGEYHMGCCRNITDLFVTLIHTFECLYIQWSNCSMLVRTVNSAALTDCLATVWSLLVCRGVLCNRLVA